MKRRTLDLIFSIGGLVLAVLLGVLGFVLKSQAVFADDYVTSQFLATDLATQTVPMLIYSSGRTAPNPALNANDGARRRPACRRYPRRLSARRSRQGLRCRSLFGSRRDGGIPPA